MGTTKGRASGEYTVSYTFPGGVDLSERGSSGRFSYLENLYRDYDADGGRCVVSIPGYRKVASLGKRVHAIYPKKCKDGSRALVVHAADTLSIVTMNKDGSTDEPRRLATVNDGKSSAFEHGYDLYFLDGVRMLKVSDGEAYEVGSDGCKPYVPTLYRSGEEYEQRNLTTTDVKEEYLIASADEILFGSPEMFFRITDKENRLCALTGVSELFVAYNITVPSYTTVSGRRYRVTEIDDGAFSGCFNIKKIIIGEGVTRIGKKAFSDCSALTEVFCPESMTEIDDNAFLRCSRLESVLVGSGLTYLGSGVFSGCTSLSTVYYTARLEDFSAVSGHAQVKDELLVKHNGIYEVLLEIPVFSLLSSIRSVSIGGTDYPFDTVRRDGRITGALVRIANKSLAEGRLASISGIAKTTAQTEGEAPTSTVGPEAMHGCTLCTVFGGRIFLSGNKAHPGTVFYSSLTAEGNTDPTYFGVYNHFTDGLGSSAVVSLLSAGDYLAVFKGEGAPDGSVFCHTVKETDSNLIPRIYPVSYIHTGISATGDAICFCDDPVFITKSGVAAIEKLTLDLNHSIATRSHNVNPALFREPLEDARLASWRGYLALAVGTSIYLADSRATFIHSSGAREYEWYILRGIGAPSGNVREVYRYASVARAGYLVHEGEDSVAYGTVMSEATEDGALVLFTVQNGKKYAVYKSEEVSTDMLSPITAIASIEEELLLFGTENGVIYLFNSDKRGEAPEHVRNTEDFDADEYGVSRERRIHPYFYSFDGRAPKYGAASPIDCCNIPNMRKDSVKGSLTVKCAARGDARVKVDVFTDKSGYTEGALLPNGEIDFSDLSFSTLSFSTDDRFTVPVREKERGWLEKQVVISSDGFRAPIGIESVSYRFTVKGKIKNN